MSFSETQLYAILSSTLSIPRTHRRFSCFLNSSSKALKVSELKEKLTELSLSTVGKKEELIARILAAAPAEGAAAAAGGDDFDALVSTALVLVCLTEQGREGG